MKKIMILGASILQLPAIKKALELGYKVICVDMNPDAIGFKEDGIIKEVISTIDIPSVMECAKRHKIDGIMTLASDMPMRTVAAVASEMGLVGINMDTAIKATNKYEMRKALLKYNVPIPEFYKVSNIDEYKDVIKKFNKPFIVKPADNSGSRGIYKLNDWNDINLALDAYNYSLKSSRSGDVIVEEYMSGPEVSVETLSLNGVCNVIQVTDKLTTGAPHFIEMGHSQPSMLDLTTINKIKNVAIAANKAIGIENGPSHTEIIVTKEGPKIVELGARLGGDCITTHLVPLSVGVDMVECCIKLSVGEKISIDKKINMGSAIRYIKQNEGVVQSIEGLEAANKIDGIKQISILCSIGDKVESITSSSSRIGFVIAQGLNAKSAIEKCESALDLISLNMKKVN